MDRPRQILLLVLTVGVLPALALYADDELRGTVAYHAWKGSPGELFAEAVEVYTADRWTSSTQWMLLTPERNRALVTREYDPKHDRWTVRFSDEESGWWAEEVLETSLRYTDLADSNRRGFQRLLEEKPSTAVTFLAAGGLIGEATNPWSKDGSGRGSDILVREWFEREGGEIDLPATTLEAIRFIVSLREEGQIHEGDPLYDMAGPLAVLVEAAGDDFETPRYSGTSWAPGTVEGTSSPAVQALLDQFDSDETKRSRAWIEATLMR